MKANSSCDSEARSIAKSSTGWNMARTMARVSQMVAMLGTAAWMGGTALFSSPQSTVFHQEPIIWLSYWPYQAVESHRGRA